MVTLEARVIKNPIHVLSVKICSDRIPVGHGFVFPVFSTSHCGKMTIQHGVDFQQASSKFGRGKAERIYSNGGSLGRVDRRQLQDNLFILAITIVGRQHTTRVDDSRKNVLRLRTILIKDIGHVP